MHWTRKNGGLATKGHSMRSSNLLCTWWALWFLLTHLFWHLDASSQEGREVWLDITRQKATQIAKRDHRDVPGQSRAIFIYENIRLSWITKPTWFKLQIWSKPTSLNGWHEPLRARVDDVNVLVSYEKSSNLWVQIWDNISLGLN